MQERNIPALKGNQHYVKYGITGAVVLLGLLSLLLTKGGSVAEPKPKPKSESSITIAQRDYSVSETKVQPQENPLVQQVNFDTEQTPKFSNEDIRRMSAPMTIIKASAKPVSYYEDSPMIARAKEINNPQFTLLQGKVIKAVLETEINSDLPGMIRAVVSEDVYADRGNSVLIPKGSRLVGGYSSDIAMGQSRVLVSWSRMVHAHKNIDVNFKSPSTDSLGRAGMTGDVNTHFASRFGQAALMSMISAGAATIKIDTGEEYSPKIAYREGVVDSFAQTATESLSSYKNIAPTIVVARGETINVFVAQDLDFSFVYGDSNE